MVKMSRIKLVIILMFIVVVSSCEKEKTGLLDICEWSFSFEPVEYDCFDLVSPYSLHNPYEKLVGKIILDNSTNETLYYYTYKQPGGVGTLHINRKWSNIDMCSPESLNEDLLFPGASDIDINQENQVIFTSGVGEISIRQMDTNEISKLSFENRVGYPLWLNNSEFALQLYDESNRYVSIVVNESGVVIDTLPIKHSRVSDFQDGNLANYCLCDNNGEIQILNLETDILDIYSFTTYGNAPSRIHWLDNDRLLISNNKVITILDLETKQEEVVLDLSNCESVRIVDVEVSTLNSNRLLLILREFVEVQNDPVILSKYQRVFGFDIETKQMTYFELE